MPEWMHILAYGGAKGTGYFPIYLASKSMIKHPTVFFTVLKIDYGRLAAKCVIQS